MAYELGKDWRVHIGDGATPTEVFTAIGGEGSFEWSRSSDDIDLTTKDDGTYKSGSYGLQAITFQVSGKLKLPDAPFQRVNTVAKSGAPELNIKIMKGTTVKFHGKVAVGSVSTTHPSEGAVTYSFPMRNVGAPIVDDIGA